MKGPCLCGAVANEITGLDSAIEHCHCTTCRKAHASAFASTARVAREHFRWLRGEEKLGGYEASPGKLGDFAPRAARISLRNERVSRI
jgi:ADP-ribosyl-[dinitrogen reductase] hydrolase